MNEDLPVSTDEYRELASFLERQIAEAGSRNPEEVDALRSRLGQLHEMLDAPARSPAEPSPKEPSPPEPEKAEGPSDPLDSLETLVAKMPDDDDLRQSYIELAESRDAQLRAAEALRRIASASADKEVRERVGFDAAMLYLGEGELPAARAAFLEVVRSGAGGAKALSAARRLLNLHVESSDPGLVGPALELLASADPEPATRREMGEKILSLHESSPQAEASLATAYRTLVGSPRTDEALGWLRGFHARRGEKGALSAWLEQSESWDPLARVLELDSELEPRGERAQLLARLGQVRVSRLHDVDGALEAFDRCLTLDPANAIARAAVETLMESGERRLVAADILEPIYRKAGSEEGQLRVLEARAAEAPADAIAIETLIEGHMKFGHVDAALAVIGRAHESVFGVERHRMMVRTARALARHALADQALAQCRALLGEAGVEAKVVEDVAQIANDEDAQPLYREALELLTKIGDDPAKKRALERLGDFHFEQLGDGRAAAESWRPAARMYENTPEEDGHAQVLYERVLEAVPDDHEAAQRLVEFYAKAHDWTKLPEVLRVHLRGGGDVGAAAQLLLRQEKMAVEAGEVGEFASLAQEVVHRLGSDAPESRHELKKARARALGSDSAYEGEASLAYREVIESSGSEEDVRAFEAFIDSRPSAEERLRERRWLYERRVTHGTRPAEALLEWAKAEEELGEVDAAIALYVRLSEVAPGQREGIQALCRLRLHAGDFEGGLAALQTLRDEGTESQRRDVIVSMARVLLEDLGRPAEAVLALTPLLDVVPPIAAVHQMMARTLAEPTTRAQIVERLEELASHQDAGVARRVFQFLVQGREESATTPEARRGWFARIVEFSPEDPETALSTALQGAAEFPDAVVLWEHAERIARELQRPAIVSKAYHDVIVGNVIEPALVETLARRLLAFEGECGASSSGLTEVLEKVLDLAPGARWALDRVKLVLGSGARWDELFRLYDRAIAVAADVRARFELLDEAASAAKDLAGQPDRAIPYLQLIHAERPDDVAVDAALERLYERQRLIPALIELLRERLEKAVGFKRHELLHRIASLWVDLGGAEQALEGIERTLAEGASVADVIEPLERLAGSSGPSKGAAALVGAPVSLQARAIELLRGHYEASARTEDVIRMSRKQLALAVGAGSRARCIRDLVDLRLAAAKGAPKPFERGFASVLSDTVGEPELERVACEALLKRALRAWPLGPGALDAQEGAWRAIQRLRGSLVEAGRARRAVGVLYRASRLAFESARRRELLRDAAIVSAEELEDPERAIRIFGELFEENPGDAVASQSVGRYADLLEGAGQYAKLAMVWEAQARVHAEAGNTSEHRACWERAAAHWERNGDRAEALRAYRQAGALSSEVAFEALARIHEGQNEWAPAAEALEWLYVHAPAQTRGLRAIHLARIYGALGDRERARSRLEHALDVGVEGESVDLVSAALIALYRRDAAWRPLAGRLAADALRARDLEKKLALLREAADLLREKLDAPAEAAALLEQAVALCPQDGTLRPRLADVLETLGRWDRVVEILRDQVAWHGEHRTKERALLHHRLARALAHAGVPKEALAELRLAAQMLPAHPVVLYDLARTALDSGMLELAESTYRALLLALHHPAEDAGATPPHRAEVFLDLSEIALRNGDPLRAADLVDSAVDVALETGERPERFESAIARRGRFDLLARAIERRVDRAASLQARAAALGDLVGVWVEHLDRAQDLGARISMHAERIGREVEHDETTDADAWTALVAVHGLLGDASVSIGTNRRLVALLESAVAKAAAGPARNRLRVIFAKALLHDAVASDPAIVALSDALEEDPTLVEAADLLSSTLEREGRFDERLALLGRRLRALTPAAASFVDAAWSFGCALQRADRNAEALAVFEPIVDKVPVDGTLLTELADRLVGLGSDRAADCMERMIAAGQSASDLARRLLDRRDREGDPARIRRSLELVFSADPGDPAIARRLIEVYRDSGDDPARCRVLDVALAASPREPALLSVRASLHETNGDHDAALLDLENASGVDAVYVDVLVEFHARLGGAWHGPVADAHTIRLVDLLTQAGRASLARQHLDRLLAKSPNHPDGLEKLASLAVAAADWDSAIDAYRRVIALSRGDLRERLPRIAALMAEACERAGRLEDAREEVERAVMLVPQDPELTKWLERICERTGDWARLVDLLTAQAEKLESAEERSRLLLRAGSLCLEKVHAPADALRWVELARAANGDSLEVTLLWAQIQQALGSHREAMAVLEEATSKSRGKRTPLIARIHLEIGKAHLAVDELVEAFEALKVAFSMDGRSGEIAVLLGLVALDLDDDKTAERVLLGVAGKAPQTDAERRLLATAYYHLASMACAKHDLGKARRLAGKAILAEPGHPKTLALLSELGDAGGATTVASVPPGPPARA
jgi:tetratricopeptide (TPR) repeat protein